MSTLKKIHFSRIFALLSVSALLALFSSSPTVSFGEETRKDTEKAANPAVGTPAEGEGWISLFDGQSLGVWKKVDEGGSGEVTVKDGAIILGMGVMGTGIKFAPEDGREFPKTDYEITFTATRSLGTDFFAALTFPVGESFCSFINGGWGGTLVGLSSLDGFDASENNTSSYFGFKNNIWYIFRVRVTTRMIRVWLDDEPVIEAFLDGREVSTRMEVSQFQPLGFTAWVCEGRIKNIFYRPLTAEERNEMNKEADRAARTERSFPVN